ncbi:MAG: transcription elongation factor GreAB [Flavobacterium sp.]|nr:MAG: transcription elongation factor GreAB [Flavobacterium sp.]
MSTTTQNQVILSKEDYEQLKYYIGSGSVKAGDMTLSHELKRAKIVAKEELPADSVRLGSTLTILDLESEQTMVFTVVMPAHADMKTKKVSVLTPMGTAFIGFKKNDEVQWKVPAGIKTFKIVEVTNEN